MAVAVAVAVAEVEVEAEVGGEEDEDEDEDDEDEDELPSKALIVPTVTRRASANGMWRAPPSSNTT